MLHPCKCFHTVNYKPRLEIILADIVLITEVAELASEAETIAAMTVEGHRSINEALTEKKRTGMLSNSKWSSLMHFGSTSTGEDIVGQSGSSDLLMEQSDDDKDDDNDCSGESEEENNSESSSNSAMQHKSVSSVSSTRIKDLLDRWEEPRAKHDKVTALWHRFVFIRFNSLFGLICIVFPRHLTHLSLIFLSFAKHCLIWCVLE